MTRKPRLTIAGLERKVKRHRKQVERDQRYIAETYDRMYARLNTLAHAETARTHEAQSDLNDRLFLQDILAVMREWFRSVDENRDSVLVEKMNQFYRIWANRSHSIHRRQKP